MIKLIEYTTKPERRYNDMELYKNTCKFLVIYKNKHIPSLFVNISANKNSVISLDIRKENDNYIQTFHAKIFGRFEKINSIDLQSLLYKEKNQRNEFFEKFNQTMYNNIFNKFDECMDIFYNHFKLHLYIGL